MPRLSEQYELRRGENLGDPETLNRRLRSIDTRLAKVEETASSVDTVIADLITLGLSRIDEALLPAFEAIQSVADVGLMFIATSDTEQEAGTGAKIFYVVAAERHRYAPPAYVAIMPTGETTPAMLGTVVSFEREHGELVVSVDRASGTGSASAWTISPASPTDNAAAAASAAGSAASALAYRADAQAYRDQAQDAVADAADARDIATAARDTAIDARDDATDARDVAVASVASMEQVWLGAKDSDPIVDNLGGALVEGAAYLNTTDGQLKYYLDGGWTNVVVPIGSEVLSAFGRTGAVTAVTGDYDSTKITRTPGDVAGITVELAIADLFAGIGTKLAASAASAYGLTLIDDADAATARGTLGLGTAATQASSAFAAASHAHAWADITSGKPTTIAGYGITDGYTKTEVDGAFSALIGGAPSALNTLNELAIAVGNDPAFASTVSAALAGKLAAAAVSSFMLALLGSEDATAVRSSLDVPATTHAHAISDVTGLSTSLAGKQSLDATLTALAGASTASDTLIYFSNTDVAAVATLTSQARALLDDATPSAMRSTLGLAIGADVQAYNANLATLAGLASVANLSTLAGLASITNLTAEAGLTGAADKMSYYTGAGTKAIADLSSLARTLLDDTTTAAMRATLQIASNDAAFTTRQTITAQTAGQYSLAIIDDLVSTPVSGPALKLYRKALHNGGTWAAHILFNSYDSASNETSYAAISDEVRNATNGAEEGTLELWAETEGALRRYIGMNVAAYPGSLLIDQPMSATDYAYFADDVDINGVISEGGTLLTAKYARLAAANALSQVQTITMDGQLYPLVIVDENDGATAFGGIDLYRNSSSPGANDVLHNIRSAANNTTPAKTTYGIIRAIARAVTAGAEYGAYQIQTAVNGTVATRVEIAQGVQIGSPSGGDKGVGTLNATAVYDDGSLVTSMPVSRQYRLTGDFDLAAWEAMLPAGREHSTAREFKRLIGEGFDARQPAQWQARLWADEVLPGMPPRDTWQHNGFSLGDLVSRMWLALDIMALTVSGLIDEITALRRGLLAASA